MSISVAWKRYQCRRSLTGDLSCAGNCKQACVFMWIHYRLLLIMTLPRMMIWICGPQALYAKGLRPRMALHPARQRFQTRSFRSMCERHMRWIRLRRSMMFYTTLAEPALECLVIGPIGMMAFRRLHRNYAIQGLAEGSWESFIGIHILLWLISDILLMYILHVSLCRFFLSAFVQTRFFCIAPLNRDHSDCNFHLLIYFLSLLCLRFY